MGIFCLQKIFRHFTKNLAQKYKKIVVQENNNIELNRIITSGSLFYEK